MPILRTESGERQKVKSSDAVGLVGDETRIVRDVGVEFLYGLQQFPCRTIITRRDGHLEVSLNNLDHL